MSIYKTTLTQRNITIDTLQYSLDGNNLYITLTTTTPHSLYGKIPITIGGVIIPDNEFNSSLVNTTHIFTVFNDTKLITFFPAPSSLIIPYKNASGSITANVNNTSIVIDVESNTSDILLYTILDGYIIDVANISYILKHNDDNISTTQPLFDIPIGRIENLKTGMKLGFEITNQSTLTNIPIVLQI